MAQPTTHWTDIATQTFTLQGVEYTLVPVCITDPVLYPPVFVPSPKNELAVDFLNRVQEIFKMDEDDVGVYSQNTAEFSDLHVHETLKTIGEEPGARKGLVIYTNTQEVKHVHSINQTSTGTFVGGIKKRKKRAKTGSKKGASGSISNQ